MDASGSYHIDKNAKITILGALMGWALDAYDLVLMLMVIAYVSELFFPSSNRFTSVLAVFATYILTLIMRPVGAALFGNYADRHGRRKTLMITILGFSLISGIQGLLPTYQMVGILAPVALIIARLVMGIFAGGEWGTGATISMEAIPRGRRGLYSGIVQGGWPIGYLIVSLVILGILSAIPRNTFVLYGWRILFFTAFGTGVGTLFVRWKMKESTLWNKKYEEKVIPKLPIREIFRKGFRRTFFVMFLIWNGLMMTYYISLGFYPTAFGIEHMTINKVALIIVGGSITSLTGYVSVGFISDYLGRRRTLLIYSIISAILVYPTIYGMLFGAPILSIVSIIVLTYFVTGMWGLSPAFLSESFPTEIRASAASFIYNGGLLGGSWGPLIVLSLSGFYGISAFPLIWSTTLFLAVIAIIIGAFLSIDRTGVDLQLPTKEFKSYKKAVE